jgi:hypothetical protein
MLVWGPLAARDSPAPAASERNRENPAPPASLCFFYLAQPGKHLPGNYLMLLRVLLLRGPARENLPSIYCYLRVLLLRGPARENLPSIYCYLRVLLLPGPAGKLPRLLPLLKG